MEARPGNKEYLTVKVHSLITRIEKLGITTRCIRLREENIIYCVQHQKLAE
ncbi:MAG: hypothetical protein F6K48_28610 [Okeania sp. SIO3H1]|uniref:hypothetical protein n=1 Tax=Okeania sp. SIO1I7 TaxID=2607772 RepID=UPI0013C833B9|nr:hypothetical protein [Okeania sp. SIO1I7]NEN92648.1 hypothetical protein [Okeania sp. SIO3H1]NET25665.1 hypothetical protein [Okeania sp. SIO1I7]